MSVELKLRRRDDLEVYPQRRRSRKVWVIKDPISLRFFQFREEEFEILRWLDGRTSLDEIKDRFEQRFTPKRMTVSRLHSFVANLHQNGLAISDSPGQGDPLLRRHLRQRRSSRFASLANPLAIRFRGLDPERFLQWLYPKVQWVFSRWSFVVCLAIVSAAIVLVATRMGEFQSRLPALNALLSPNNLIWLAVAIGCTKFIHEMGHALTCKHFGGQCHEMGVMLLVFTPCLYCNVTDAWKLSSRYQRIAISAAGIVVEIVLASSCALLWWFSQPGLFNTICFNVMLVGSIGTLLLNGNPLLRYDGYYILSDAIDAPNLWQESRGQVRRLASRLFLGFDPGNRVSLQNRSAVLLLYALTSMAYRLLVLTSIVYLVYQFCNPRGLLLIAQLITALLLVGVCSAPVVALSRMMTDPILRRKISPVRLVTSVFVSLGIVVGCFLIPLPCRVTAPVLVEPLDARSVYVTVPGRIIQAVEIGDAVKRGDVLASLENIEIQRELENVRGELRVQESRIRNMESVRATNDAVVQLPAAREMRDDLRLQLRQLEKDVAALTLIAPVDGNVMAPPSRMATLSTVSHLSAWGGTPLDKQNLGSMLERKTLFCQVGQPDQFEAVVYIHQSDIPFVKKDQRLRLLMDINAGRVIRGTIGEISRVNIQSVPAELAIDQQLANQVDQSGTLRPEETAYKAYVDLDSTELPLLVGARGTAKVWVSWQPLSKRIIRFLSRTFKPVL